jgi:hypothetical protein
MLAGRAGFFGLHHHACVGRQLCLEVVASGLIGRQR